MTVPLEDLTIIYIRAKAICVLDFLSGTPGQGFRVQILLTYPQVTQGAGPEFCL